MRTLLAAAAAVLLLAACGDDIVRPGDFAMTGDWLGQAGGYELRLALVQDGADVRGTGELRAGADTVGVDARGTWDYPAVALALSAPDFADAAFEGQFVTRDSVQGTLRGSGFAAQAILLVRQRPAPTPDRSVP